VLKSTDIWGFVYECIEARVKTDKVEAETLAHLLRLDLILRSHAPNRDIRDLRYPNSAGVITRC